ncbi:MAG TPA: ankyrin repeat domain-containing protein [Gemmatimonadaceae bacterium]|jgi:ankyrin repeat protein|nr:ankyrin repeat domain-containing protein [Gemmatimonadaceae bacterium]
MPRVLPEHPSLEHLKKQAKDLLHDGGATRLADAQRLVAREYGFPSWAKLKAHVESFVADPATAFAAAINSHDLANVTRVLERFPVLKTRLDEPLANHTFGTLAIVEAAEHGDREIVDLLVRSGADINAVNDWWAGGFGVLDVARPDMTQFLLDHGATMTAHGASRLGRLEDLERIIAADPSVVHKRGGDGQTPLHFASTVEVARYLVEHQANIDARCVDHESTPAQWMIRDRQDVARFLVAAGCRTDILMCAALGDLERVRAHLDADPASVHTTVDRAHFPMKDPRAGGTIYQWSLGAFKTPHLIAHEFGHADVFDLLMSRSPMSLRLTTACELGDDEAVDTLMRDNPGLVSRLSEEERRRVALAAELNDTRAVRTLLRAGWPVDMLTGPNGASALHWAGFHGNVEMAKEILRYHPALEVKEQSFGGTPLTWTSYGSVHGYAKNGDYPATMAVLLDAGVQVPDLDKLEPSDEVMAVLRSRR